nr:putative reverse transcriptase domain-containing protein [Tanacetum cinerariifolium]
MYYDLRDRYWWLGMKKDIAMYSIQEAIETRLDMSTAYHPQIDGHSKRIIQTLKDMLRACVLDFEGSWDVHLLLVKFSYNNSNHSSVRCVSFEVLYGRKCHSPIMWEKIKEGQMIGPELVQETIEKISQIKDRLKATFVVCFGKKGKLAPRFVGPFDIIKKVGLVAYRLDLPKKLDGVHGTFHVLNLKKCLADPTLQVPLDVIRVDVLNFVEEPVEIIEREFKKLKLSRIAIVKVEWNSKRRSELTWERKDQMKLKVRIKDRLGFRIKVSVRIKIKGKVSSIPTVLSWVDNINSDGFLPSILLLVVVIVTVIIVVTVISIVVVVGSVSSIIKLSFVIIGWANEFHQDRASSVRVPVANFSLQSSVQLLRENTDSSYGNTVTNYLPDDSLSHGWSSRY